jgi:hypothetical protein
MFKFDIDFMRFSIDTFFELMPAKEDAPGVLPVLSFQATAFRAMKAIQ